MASKDRAADHSVIGELFRLPFEFDFFQAVRLLEKRERELQKGAPAHEEASRAGSGSRHDAVRFLAHASLSFPAGNISQLAERPARRGVESTAVSMVVTFLGLTGPSGVLPRHYSELLLQRIRDKDYALRDFLDLFQDRIVRLFYETWKKHRLPIGYEGSQLDDPRRRPDLATWGLSCLVGLGTPGLRGRMDVDDEVFLYFSGHFAHSPRSASALASLLAEFLDLTVQVEQLQGQWLSLDVENQACMPSRRRPEGNNNELGVNLIVGDRVWDIQSKFQLRVGPLGWRQFCTLLPIGNILRRICQVTRLFVGPEFDFDVQLIVEPGQVPPSQLTNDSNAGMFLGWTTWLCSTPIERVVNDAVFASTETAAMNRTSTASPAPQTRAS